MDYERILESLIERARGRTHYDTAVHHKHHVVPRHIDPLSSDVVILTHKEHAVVHHLRYRIWYRWQDRVAWKLLKFGDAHSDELRTVQIEAGKRGGRTTKDNAVGIFHPEYDRSYQSRLNYSKGLGLASIPPEKRSAHGKEIATRNIEQQRGLFNPELQHLRSLWAKIGQEALKKAATGEGSRVLNLGPRTQTGRAKTLRGVERKVAR